MHDLTVVETPANWDRLNAMVLDSVSSPSTKRVYNMAFDEFLAWFRQAPRPGFTKATVSAWRVSLEERRLGASSIIIRMAAIRKLAAEAADNGMLAPELAAGIARVKSAKSVGIRTGNWLIDRARHKCWLSSACRHEPLRLVEDVLAAEKFSRFARPAWARQQWSPLLS